MHSNLEPVKCAAIYTRRSYSRGPDDPRAGASQAEQEADCRALAARLGLHVAEVFPEREGTGASHRSRAKRRPQWDRALAALASGDQFRTLIAWSLDRTDRRGSATVGAFLDKHENTDRRIVTVDGIDTGDERQRLSTILRAEIAREESELLSSRVRRARRYMREAGVWTGRPPYGLRADAGRLVRDAETHAQARDIADEIMAGTPVTTIIKRLNRADVPTPTGRGSWAVATITRMVAAPGFAGLAKDPSTGDVLHSADGESISVGAGVVTPAERLVILAKLRERRGVNGKGRRRGTTLLSGALCCAGCEGRGEGQATAYRCALGRLGGCPAPFVAPQLGVDFAVVQAFLGRLAAMEPEDELLHAVAARWTAYVDPAAAEQHAAAQEAHSAAEEDLRRTVTLVTDGVITPEEARGALERKRAAVAAAGRKLAAAGGVSADMTPLLDMAQSTDAWDALELAEQRALLRLGVERAEVRQSGGHGRFDPRGRVVVWWVDGTRAEL